MEDSESDEIEINDTDATIDSLERIIGEASDTVDYQASTLGNIDDNAVRIYRANILLISVVVGAISIAVRNDGVEIGYLININSAFGALSLVTSIAFAGVTYTSSDIDIGVRKEDIKDTLSEDYVIDELYRELALGYAKWISDNEKVLERNGDLMAYTVISAVNGIAFLTIGVITTGAIQTQVHDFLWLPLVIIDLLLLIIAIKIALVPDRSFQWYFGISFGVFILSTIIQVLPPIYKIRNYILDIWLQINAGFRFDLSVFIITSLIMTGVSYHIFNLDY
ncbi:hypothetical protein ACFQL1_11210 [Halomicroarcula sp. GCM10025709]|uniref:hypothetical protein n=1 Tax=Haloarcula TaxID=2237 RepID=UPI0024C373D2|nr:hypothetical protein [Halomicroarcula sp. YJ-61-S]